MLYLQVIAIAVVRFPGQIDYLIAIVTPVVYLTEGLVFVSVAYPYLTLSHRINHGLIRMDAMLKQGSRGKKAWCGFIG